MAGITLAQAETKLALWLEADTKVSSNQSYSVAGRTYTRADAEEIRNNITYWNNWVVRLSRGGIRVRKGVPLHG